jgi:manganese/iron transport system ATP-binding protein
MKNRMTVFEEFQKTSHHFSKQRPAHDSSVPILSVENLSLKYPSGYAIENISFEVKKGERLAVVGPNGAGKSTLFKIIAGVLNQTSGDVNIYGQSPGGHICIAYVAQRNQVDWNFPVTIGDVVMMGRIGQLGLFRNPGTQDKKAVREALKVVGLENLADRQINQLSGGQQQRMFIARSLAQDAELMLMDEPTSGLDAASQEEIFIILDRLREQGVTVLLALHDLKIAARRFDRVMLLNKRLLALGFPDEVLIPDNLVAAYSGHLHLVETEDGLLAVGDSCCDDEIPRL